MKFFMISVWMLLLMVSGTFGYLTWEQNNIGDINFSDKVSLMSSFFMAVLTALYVMTTSKQIEVANLQLEEMKYDRSLKEQPILLLTEKSFWIERPRFFYTPPEDRYSFLSRYYFALKLRNCTTYPAVVADVTARIKIVKDGKERFLATTANRCNIIAANDSVKMSFMFPGDAVTWMFDSLREGNVELLPRIELTVMYKNVCGGCFRIEECVILIPENAVEKDIISWHSCINATNIEEREKIDYLKRVKGTKEWDIIFDGIKKDFDRKLGQLDKIDIKCLDEIEKYKLSVIDIKEYEQEINEHYFGRRVHKKAPCKMK